MTGPVTTEALVSELAEAMLRHEWPNSPLVPFAEQDERIRNYWLGHAKAQIAGPLAPLLAALQQVTAERDAAISACAEMIRLADMSFDEAMAEPEESGSYAAYQRAKAACEAAPGVAEAAKTLAGQLATATSELARLRAEGEAKDRDNAVTALMVIALCNSVLGNAYLGKDGEEALAGHVKAAFMNTALARAITNTGD